MKPFIHRLSVCMVIVLGGIVYIFSFANGYTDAFYMRFTTPKQQHMIVGTSRAAQALQPDVFEGILDKKIYNYAFTVAHSPYGPAYLNSIKRKLDPNAKDGVFIVAVSPWSISSKSIEPNDSLNFRELKRCVGNTRTVNLNPNIEYLLKNFDGKYVSLITQDTSNYFLHDNGWLEVTVKMNDELKKERLRLRIADYNRNMEVYRFSNLRLNYLKKTIDFLKTHGKVYVVRLPIHKEMLDIEDKYMPDFDSKIDGITNFADAYYDFTDKYESYQYIDGNHLHKDSGQLISEQIALMMKVED